MKMYAVEGATPATTAAPKADAADLARVIAASTARSAMEWYDFIIYGRRRR